MQPQAYRLPLSVGAEETLGSGGAGLCAEPDLSTSHAPFSLVELSWRSRACRETSDQGAAACRVEGPATVRSGVVTVRLPSARQRRATVRLAVACAVLALWLHSPQCVAQRGTDAERAAPSLALQVGHSQDIDRMIFSPDGRTLASGAWSERQTRLWDTAAGRVLAVLEGYPLCLSHDGTLLTTGTQGKALVWQARTGLLERTIAGQPQWVFCADFSPDDARLATMSLGPSFLPFPDVGNRSPAAEAVSSAPIVSIWDLQSGRLMRTLDTGSDRVGFDHHSGLAFGPDGSTLAVACCSQRLQRGTLSIWDMGQPEPAAPNATTGSFARFSPDGSMLATDDPSGGFVLISALTGGSTALASRCAAPDAACVAFSADGSTLAVPNESGGIDVHRVDAGDPAPVVVPEPEDAQEPTGGRQVCCVALSAAGETLGVASVVEDHGKTPDCQLSLCNRDSGATRTIPVPGLISKLRFSPRRDVLAASVGGQVELFDPNDGRLVRTLVGRPALSTSVTASPDAAMVSVSGQAGTWLWDLSTAQPRPVIVGASQPLDESIASGAPEMVFSPDGSVGAVRTLAGKVSVCDVATEQVTARLDCSGIPVGFSPDADLVAILHRGGPSSSTAYYSARAGM